MNMELSELRDFIIYQDEEGVVIKKFCIITHVTGSYVTFTLSVGGPSMAIPWGRIYKIKRKDGADI